MPKLVLGKKKLETLRRMPLIESFVRKSKDGNYLVHKTVITSIRPVEYYMSVLEEEIDLAEADVEVVEEKMEV